MELLGSCSTFSSHLAQKSHKLRWTLDIKSLEWCKGSQMQNANGFHHAWTTFSFETVYLLYLWDHLSPIAKQDCNCFNPFSSAAQNRWIVLRIKWLSAEAGFSPVSLQLHYFRHLRVVFWLPSPAVILSICDERHCPTRVLLPQSCVWSLRQHAAPSAATVQITTVCFTIERSLCLLMKYDSPVRETTEYLIFRVLTCPKEYTFKSTQRGGCQKTGKEPCRNEAKWFRNTNKI